MNDVLWRIGENETALIATAIHDGHSVRDAVAQKLNLSDSDCLREEDPHTGRLAQISPNFIIPKRSRFEVDLNRPREKAVYVDPEDAWGLKVWKERPTDDFINQSLGYYDDFYTKLSEIYADMSRRFGAFVVYDLHSYNHRRAGPDNPPADPGANPEVNVGTGTMDRDRWAGVVDRFIGDLAAFERDGRRLDVRENVKFYGGNHANWSHQTFSDSACVIAVEFKKFFMDEWTGEVYAEEFDFISKALQSTFDGVQSEARAIAKRTK